jgi:molybdenum cofactor guanylyltransferase
MQANGMAGVVLGGGEGRRLGGVIKPLLRVGGVPVLTRTLARLRPRAAPLLIASGRIAAERFAGFDADGCVPDATGVSGGPLAGIFAAVGALQARGAAPDWLLSVAGDCPDLPENLPQTLIAEMAPGIDVVFAAYDGQLYPPNALWRVPALIRRRAELGDDPQGRGPRQLFPPESCRACDFSTRYAANPFAGLNMLSDIVADARARRRTGHV